MDPDAVVDSLRPGFARGVIGGDNQGFVACLAQMLEYPKHRVADTIYLGEEGLCDDRNAHTTYSGSAGCRQGC